MPLNEYPSGTAFPGVIGRTADESSPAWPAPVRAPKGAANVLFIVLDDTGFGQLGCYGSPIATPNLDRLAEQGLRYNNMRPSGSNAAENGRQALDAVGAGPALRPQAGARQEPVKLPLARVLLVRRQERGMVRAALLLLPRCGSEHPSSPDARLSSIPSKVDPQGFQASPSGHSLRHGGAGSTRLVSRFVPGRAAQSSSAALADMIGGPRV